jgi:multiple sugar transport system substrate-binding protein
MADRRVHELARALYQGKLDRRDFMRAATALGVSSTAINLFLRGASTARAQSGTPAANLGPVPPVVAQPCGDNCLFSGQTVTVLVNVAGERGPIEGPFHEVRDEFEAATGAKLEIVAVPFEEHFPKLIEDLSSGTGQYDTSIAGAWWLGELVAGDYLVAYDDLYNDKSGKYPAFNYDDVLPGPRSLLEYDGKKYMVPNDHDGQVMYYRRDLFNDPTHQKAFADQFGYDLAIPTTWDQFTDMANYFNGKDLNGDGQPDHGVTMHLKVGGQGMFHFMSFSAPYVIGPDNPHLYWFNPDDMTPLVASPGHAAALNKLIDLAKAGPEAMFGWSLGESWDYFLAGRAALTFSWGDLGALAQETPDRGGKSTVKGKTGSAPIPGTMGYYNVAKGEMVTVDQPNIVGNTTGGSWSGVISKLSKAPEATYFLLALMATKPKALVYGYRGWDGVDPGWNFQFLPPNGTANIKDYVDAGWDQEDATEYTNAYYTNFSAKNQFPYLRIPGTFEYWQAMDVRLSEAVTGQASAEDSLQNINDDWEGITDRYGRDAQLEVYKKSLGL